jgi:hypothetical protein
MKNIHKINKNIFITSDEEIKEGDWFYNIVSLKPEPFKACENGDGYVNCSKYSHYRIDCKKIILTTDQNLIKDGIQPIDDEFLEWFVKNSSCEKVDVIPSEFLADKVIYEINIPQEESKQETHICKWCKAETWQSDDECYAKPETLEEFIKVELEGYDEIDFSTYERFIKLGAKWQAEKMYSEEEVIDLLNDCRGENPIDIKKWFEQFKKK